jgi:hypothetical protein
MRRCILALATLLLLSSSSLLTAQQKDLPPSDASVGGDKVGPPVQLRLGVARPTGGTARETGDLQDEGDLGELQGKWIVRFVKRDGTPNAAQIGQQLGDIITVKKDGQQLALG